MDVYESIPEQIQVIGIWDGEDHGPVIDWLNDNGYPNCVQVEDDKRAEYRAEVKAKRGDVGDVDREKVLAILGRGLYQHVTIEQGNAVVLRTDFNGVQFPGEADSTYLATGYRKLDPAEQPPTI